MKPVLLISISLFLTTSVFAQLANDNTLSVQIDGKEYKTAPRRINIGAMWYITANAVKPDKSLRFWFVTFEGKQVPGPGRYKIVDENYDTRRKTNDELLENGKYKGLAFARYAEETRTPRMEFHLGKSRGENGGEIEIITSSEKSLEGKFNATLDGTYWKERTSSTVFGGLGRLKGKLQDKVITSATGYDSDIDPEKWDYKRQDQKDEIVLKDGVFKLVLSKE